MNEELFKKSPKLRQYAEFIAKVRELNKLYDDYDRAVREATSYCIANDILSDFLREQGGKIVSILSTEFDLDVAKGVWLDEGKEEKALEIAATMLIDGEPVEKIIRYTGLSRGEVENLRTTI